MDKTERRQQILNHARDVFAKRGYHAAKIDDIVAAAGVAPDLAAVHFIARAITPPGRSFSRDLAKK